MAKSPLGSNATDGVPPLMLLEMFERSLLQARSPAGVYRAKPSSTTAVNAAPGADAITPASLTRRSSCGPSVNTATALMPPPLLPLEDGCTRVDT
jgi:hypothetical protein